MNIDKEALNKLWAIADTSVSRPGILNSEDIRDIIEARKEEGFELSALDITPQRSELVKEIENCVTDLNVLTFTKYEKDNTLSIFVNSCHVDPPFLDVDPPAEQAINVRA